MQMALAQAMQQADSAGLEARLAALEGRMCASLQGSPDSRRMTHDLALLGYEAIRAEDLNSVLLRLVRTASVVQTASWRLAVAGWEPARM